MKNFTTNNNYLLMFRTFCLLSLLIFSSAFTSSESNYYKGNLKSKMMLSGYANLNNWVMDFKRIDSEGSFTIEEGELSKINALKFDIVPSTIKGENAAIDSVLSTILSNGGSSKISFRLTKQMVLPIMKRVHLIGEFTIAGVTNPIALQMNYELDDQKNIKIMGTNTISLDEFADSATSAELKALKCSDKLTFSLTLNLQNKSGVTL